MQPPAHPPTQQQQQQQPQQPQQPPQLPSHQSLQQQQTPQQSRSQAAVPSNGQNYWQPAYPPSATSSAVEPEMNKQQQQQQQLQKDTLDELKAELEESDALQPTINEAAIEQLAKKVSELNTSEDTVVTTKPSEEQPRRRYDNQTRGRGGHRHYGDRQFNKNKTEFSIPTSEFDFEASNAKFDKSEIVKKDHEEVNDAEEEEVDIPQPDEFYDKVGFDDLDI